MALLAIFAPISEATAAACGDIPVHSHRGARPEPENTAASVTAAARGGFDAAEIDIQMLSDGTWAMHHDAATGRAVRPRSSLGRTGVPLMLINREDWSNHRTVGRGGPTEGPPPSLFADGIAAARAANIGLNVEIKQHVTSCGSVRRAVEQARVLGDRVQWTTMFPATANCLADLQLGYVAIVVLSQADADKAGREAEAAASRAREVGRTIGMFSPNTAAAMGDGLAGVAAQMPVNGNRRYAVPGTIASAARILGGARVMAVHLPASDLAANPGIVAVANAANLRVAVYEDTTTSTMLDAVRAARPRPQMIITDATSARAACP